MASLYDWEEGYTLINKDVTESQHPIHYTNIYELSEQS